MFRFVFFFLALSLSSHNEIDSVKQDIDMFLDKIDEKLKLISGIRTEIRAIQSLNKLPSNLDNKISKINEEKQFMLTNIDTFQEMKNLKIMANLFSKNDLTLDLPNSWMVKSPTPAFTFTTPHPILVNSIAFDPLPECCCLIKQFRFDFYHNDQVIYLSKIYDLPNGYQDEIVFDLETNVVCSKFTVRVIENWGDTSQTYLNIFHLLGPTFEDNY